MFTPGDPSQSFRTTVLDLRSGWGLGSGRDMACVVGTLAQDGATMGIMTNFICSELFLRCRAGQPVQKIMGRSAHVSPYPKDHV